MNQESVFDKYRQEEIFQMVRNERRSQVAKWGKQQHEDGVNRTGDAEVMEFKKALCESRFYRNKSRGHRWTEEDTGGREVVTWRDIADEEDAEVNAATTKQELAEELVQSIAVKVAWLEDLLEQRDRGEW